MSSNTFRHNNYTSNEYFEASTSFTRPADVTQYAVGDAISDSTSAPNVLELQVSNADRMVVVTDIAIISSVAAGTTPQFTAFFTGEDLSSATIDDNDALDIDSATFNSNVEAIQITETHVTASQAKVIASGASKPIRLTADGKLNVILSALNTYTPTSGEVFYVFFKGYIC